jgi:type III restriction enzyme
MAKLQTLLNDIPPDVLPPGWTTFDLASFSRTRSLWDYQEAALHNALKALWKYYADEENEAARKARFFEWYLDNLVALDNDLFLGRKRDNPALLSPYYPITDSRISYVNFINRMGFWMATGSGKTLVIVKLLELLWTLMQRRLVPIRDVMMLTHREDLLQQLRDHVQDYNSAGRIPHIRLRDLREYPDAKRGMPSLLGHQELTVFSYRSDNLSDEQKERIIDFRNYENNGQWYVLLDEAHKGDKEDSKRQHIYSILSREGFLFNFSATFTDPRDILTTAYEFNLASFITSGYGKHISLLKQENRAFRDREDYTNEEKQRIVLQSLLMFTYVSKAHAALCEAMEALLYHRPLLLALVNSVNVEEADLKLFFRELARIGQGGITSQAFTAAKTALRAELIARPEWLYEGEAFTLDQALFDSLTFNDVLQQVYNASGTGEIEVLARPSNEKELAFKLKTAAAPFALIKIGSTADWLKKDLAGYEVVKGFEDESFFAYLNEEDSEINLLMGSRSFYEGWDSNRPNVITFINIGVGEDARKFILQAVGRGVRIEPMRGKRKRLASLHTTHEIDDRLFQVARPYLTAIESLFIFGTKREALSTIFAGLDKEREKEEGVEISLDVNTEALSSHPLLVPIYRVNEGHLLVEQREPRKFEIQTAESELLNGYVDYLDDDRLLLAHHGLSPKQIGLLHNTLESPEAYFNPNTSRKYGALDILIPRLAQYFDLIPHEVQGFKELDNEINHFKHIRVVLEDISELQKKIKIVKEYRDPEEQKKELRHQLINGQISEDEFDAEYSILDHTEPDQTFDHQGQRLHIKHIARHYYLPLLLSDDELISYINRVIRVKSEIHFTNQLEAYLKEADNLFKNFDWWLFSRAEETLDRVIIPYYDPTVNKIREFHPDFIFWLVKGDNYTILFVDPKGMIASGYQHKIDGYKALFRDEAEQLRVFKYGRYEVRVGLAMYTTDANQAPQEYRRYWYDRPEGMVEELG